MNSLKDKEEQYKRFLQYSQPYYTRPNRLKSLFSFLGIGLLGFGCAFLFYSTFINVAQFDNKIDVIMDGSKKIEKRPMKKEKKSFSMPFFNHRQNILVLGVDSNGNNTDPFLSTRSDTILIANIDPFNHSVNIISIPRDSKVYLANGKGVQKINHAHAIGGIDLTKRTIEETLGIKIDRYIIVNAQGVRKLVDTIGGIPIYIEKPLHYNDYAGKLHINLEKGTHKLNGEQVENYLRYRNDGLGDIGRTSRQQWFLKSLIETLQKPSVIPQIPEALRLAATYVKTDMSLYELSHFAVFVRDINMDLVETATLPGGPSEKGPISYWILDPEKTQDLVDRMIYRVKPAKLEKYSAVIVSDSKKEETAKVVKDKLEEVGIDVSCVARGKMTHPQIITHKKEVTVEEISKLKRKVPELQNMQVVFDPNKLYCGYADFTIIFTE